MLHGTLISFKTSPTPSTCTLLTIPGETYILGMANKKLRSLIIRSVFVILFIWCLYIIYEIDSVLKSRQKFKQININQFSNFALKLVDEIRLGYLLPDELAQLPNSYSYIMTIVLTYFYDSLSITYKKPIKFPKGFVIIVIVPGSDQDSVFRLESVIGCNIVDHNCFVKGPAQHGDVFEWDTINVGQMISIEFITDAVLRINFLEYLIRILLQSRCKNSNLEISTCSFEELLCKRSHMKQLRVVIIMDQSLIQIQDQEQLFACWRQVRVAWHFQYLPFECFVQYLSKLYGLQFQGALQHIFQQILMGSGLSRQSNLSVEVQFEQQLYVKLVIPANGRRFLIIERSQSNIHYLSQQHLYFRNNPKRLMQLVENRHHTLGVSLMKDEGRVQVDCSSRNADVLPDL